MGIAFGSINTGLPKDIVKQIVDAEKIPIKQMESRKEKINDKKKLVSELTELMQAIKGNLSKNNTETSLRELKVNTNESIIGIATDKNVAKPGNYQFEVVQMARKSSAMSSGFEDPNESYVGVGFIQYYLPNGESKEIYVDSENSNLNGIAKLINEDSKSGMRANVVNDGTDPNKPWRLILSLNETGDEQKADFPYFYFVDGVDDLYLEFEREAQDAIVKLDGFQVELPTNKSSTLIPGLTIDLKKASPGEEFSIQVAEDTNVITDKIKSVVDQINGVLKFIIDQNKIDEKSDTSRTLGGDLILQTLESRIRSTVFQPVKTDFGAKRVGDLGVAFNRGGLLEFDEKIFDKAMKDNFKLSSQILTGAYDEQTRTSSDGFIDNILNIVDGSLRFPNGILQTRKSGLEESINQIDRRIEQRQRTIEQKERSLKDKFARLEGTISKLKSQGSGISSLGGAIDPVQQLG